ncbi:MAG: DUF3638 domain-containing protein, partial [Legionellaceae bacterium]|nr:DUF3638 domain-containing protein [Legionellaceae bacterium]
MPPIVMNEKLFAHINNDAFLSGSVDLQGNQFMTTIGYLDQYMQQYPKEVSAENSEDVAQLMTACKNLVEVEQALMEALHNPELALSIIQKTVANIHEKIKTLKNEEDYLLLPGGWLAANGGHAMIYRLSKDKEGNLLFSIHNTGAGLQYHEKKSETEKALYNPVLTYKIPKEKIGSKHLKVWMTNVLSANIPSLHGLKKIEPSYLYKTLFAQLSYLKGVIVQEKSPSEYSTEQWYTAGQLSGTCAQRSLHQMLKKRFKSQALYRQFIYRFKAHALDEYMVTLRSNGRIKEAKYQSQVDKAIRHQLRLLRYLPEFPEKKQQFQKLKKYLAELTKERRAMQKKAASAPKPKIIKKYPAFPVTDEQNSVGVDVKPATPAFLESVMQIQGGKDLCAQMDALIQRCKNLEDNHQYQALFEQLELFFTRLPLPKENLNEALLPFYQSLNSEKTVLDFYQKMNTLQALYFKSCDQTVGKTSALPRMLIVKMSIVAVTGHLNAHHPLGTVVDYYQKVSDVVYKVAPGSPDAAYVATNILALDNRYQNIRALYKNSSEPLWYGGEYSYYQDIINTAPHLKEKLETLYVEKYNNIHSPLHLAIRAEKCTSLHYLLENYQELLDDHSFDTLTVKFDAQINMEKLYQCFNHRFEPHRPFYRDSTERLELVVLSGDSLFMYDIKVHNEGRSLFISKALQQAKYPVRDDAVACALAQDIQEGWWVHCKKRKDNVTQLLPADDRSAPESIAQRDIQAKDLEGRELFHLRSVPSTQIVLTLDYFFEYINKTSRQDIQRYIEATICQPVPLIAQLSGQNAEQFLKRFDAFIQHGLAYFDKGGLFSADSIFFIRLAYLVNQYAAQYHPERYEQRLQDFYTRLNMQLNIQSDLAIQNALHHYRFLVCTANKTKIAPPELLFEALSSLFRIQASNVHIDLDTDSQCQLLCVQHHFMRIVQRQQADISPDWGLHIVKDLGIALEGEIDITGAYPLFSLCSAGKTLYTLDVERGLLFSEKGAYCAAPLDLLAHPIARAFGLNAKSSCFVSVDGQTYSFDKPPTKFTKSGDSYSISRIWPNAAGEDELYVLTPLSIEHSLYWSFPPVTSFGLFNWLTPPPLLQERDTLLWRGVNTDLLSQPNGTILARGDRKSGELTEQKSHKILLEHHQTWIQEKLRVFEDPSLFTFWGDKSEYSIQLARYGLTFTASPASTEIQWSWEGQAYQLVEPSPALGEDIAHLMFKHQDEEVAVLSVQKFITSGERAENSEYYRLQQDKSAKIPVKVMQELLKTKEPQCWQYSNTERFMVYKMHKGQPVPATSAEALYLCYLYLGANQPEKAWAVLEDCDTRLGGLAGTYEELQYLQWMMQALPHVLEDNDADAEISSPPYVACKLKALSLLTQFSSMGKEIAFPDAVSAPETVNGQYERHIIAESKKFYANINGYIYEYFLKLQAMRRDLSADYVFNTINHEKSRVEIESLLDYYHENLPKVEGERVAVGALGYEWVQLHLNTLKKEWEKLSAKNKVQPLTDYEQRRLQEIEAFLDTHEGVSKLCSKLVYREVSLDLPGNIAINRAGLSEESKILLAQPSWYQKAPIFSETSTFEQQQSAIDLLDINISDELLIQNFNAYFLMATTAASAENALEPLQKELMDFCEATLLAHRHVALEKQATNIPLLCNILYRLLHHVGSDLPKIDNMDDLIKHARSLPAEALKVPELQNDAHELLISARDLWNSSPSKIETKAPKNLALEPLVSMDTWFDASLREMQQQWLGLEKRLRSGHHETQQSEEEHQAGAVKYEALKSLQRLAKERLQSAETQKRIQEESVAALQTLRATQRNLEKEFMQLASSGPANAELKQQWDIDVASGKRAPLEVQYLLEHQLFTQDDIRNHAEKNDLSESAENQLHQTLTQYRNRLLTLYFHQDVTRYTEETGLSEGNINKLHHTLTKYIQKGLQCQQYERILKQLSCVETASEEEHAQALFLLAQALFAENKIDVVADPALSLFQYVEKILLRPQQKEVLERLFKGRGEGKFDELVEKIIMGGGKSKVLLPALAQKKATGENLVIIEVPRALLRTNYIDLKATSTALFNQRPYLFEFSRDSDCSVQRLKKIYKQLTEVMTNKRYMVTTGDALQSLELKYLELLMVVPEVVDKNPKEAAKIMQNWQDQVLWAERLVLLMRHRGDAIIDEAHQGLLLKNKLNYTLGEGSPIAKSIVKHAIGFYQFFAVVQVPDLNMSLHDALIKREKWSDPALMQQAMDTLVDKLLHHEKSPLRCELADWSLLPSYDETLFQQYLCNAKEAKDIPAFVLQSSSEVQEKIAFYKEQVSNLLSFTLKRHQGEHYGPSKLHKDPAKRMLAIPYIANNVPNERRCIVGGKKSKEDSIQSKFANFMESMNDTIQSCLIMGISKDLLRLVFQDWLVFARQELQEKNSKNIDETATAAMFRSMSGTLLSTLNLEDEAAFEVLHQKLKGNEDLIFSVLESHILPNIKTNEKILHSDTYNHINIKRSNQCITGTPWNHSTFHQSLKFSSASALGTDSYILRGIQEKNPSIRGVDFVDTDSFIEALFSPYEAQSEVRAIIDINASFKGVENVLVAQSIATYIYQNKEKFNKPKDIKYVLFFNEKDELSALRVQDKVEAQIPVVIGSSDPETISARLGCKPSERFTYYDQAHTVGTDIQQSAQAKALVLADEEVTLPQGAMRMRGLLEGNQSIDIVVPSALADQSFESLTDRMAQKLRIQLQQDNFSAALSKISNVLRNNVMQRLLALQGDNVAQKKHAFLKVM